MSSEQAAESRSGCNEFQVLSRRGQPFERVAITTDTDKDDRGKGCWQQRRHTFRSLKRTERLPAGKKL